MNILSIDNISLKGRHIIEASAGTGKTYSIVGIYIRLLLEKKLLPNQILVMTFTKDATQEIISRVEKGLREKIKDKSLKNEAKKHLKTALLHIDEASIFTIHSFCKKILSEQAFASRMEMDIVMEADTSDLLIKSINQYFRENINKNKPIYELLKNANLHTPNKFIENKNIEDFLNSTYDIYCSNDNLNKLINDIKQLKKEKLENFLNLEKDISDFLNKKGKNEQPNQRENEYKIILDWLNQHNNFNFPETIKIFTNGTKLKAKQFKNFNIKPLKELCNNLNLLKQQKQIQKICIDIRLKYRYLKEQRKILNFEDLIIQLHNAVKNSSDLVKILQEQYPVALIDEFQDTDLLQYEILNAIYPKEKQNLLLLMIGDPKQAIYGFRGGDIFTYLKAKNSCNYENIWGMETNWRSTKEMIKAYNRLFYTEDFNNNSENIKKDIFSEGINYNLVNFPKESNDKQLIINDNLKAINYFYSDEDIDKFKGDKKLSEWVANEIVRLLNLEKVKQSDIAILVSNKNQADIIKKKLSDKNLNSVYLSERQNVYDSLEAKEILAVMEAVNNPSNQTLIKKALSTSLFGSTATDFIKYLDGNNNDYNKKISRIKNLQERWVKSGFMNMIINIIHQDYQQRTNSKERNITNILHLAELIKIAENKYKNPKQLIKWYREQINNKNSTEAELRLESDDNLIKIITIHGSKGLEYPIVFIPFASYVNTKNLNEKFINKYHDKQKVKTIYSIGKDKQIKEIVNRETIEELKRLFYVAVTRAEQRCYIGAVKYSKCEESPLAQFLQFVKGDNWSEKIEQITNNFENQSSIINIDDYQNNQKLKINNIQKNTENLKAKEIILKNDNWQMLSYSKISQGKQINFDLEKDLNDDIKEENITNNIDSNLPLRFRATKGADIGNLLHNVFEETDFSSINNINDIDDELIFKQMNKYNIVEKKDTENLKKWILECFNADIPSIDSNDKSTFSLNDINNLKTIKETNFYLPIKNNELYKTEIFKILAKYRNCNLEDINNTNNFKVFGMLHGFIDLIFEYEGKYYVADYKSNHLGNKIENYTQEAMKNKNEKSLYDLQYLIYSVALVRFLKENIKNFDFNKHFGGVYYLYLRGMKNGYGVYKTKPSEEIINSFNKLFNKE